MLTPTIARSGYIASGHVRSGTIQGEYGATRHIASGTVGTNDLGSGVRTDYSERTVTELMMAFETVSGSRAICMKSGGRSVGLANGVVTPLSGPPINNLPAIGVVAFGAGQLSGGLVRIILQGPVFFDTNSLLAVGGISGMGGKVAWVQRSGGIITSLKQASGFNQPIGIIFSGGIFVNPTLGYTSGVLPLMMHI